MNSITKTDIYGYAFLIFIFTISIYVSYFDLNFFENKFIITNGPVNYATAFMFFSTTILLLFRITKLIKSKSVWWNLGILVFALVFLFETLNELSWGQSILGQVSSDSLSRNYLFVENENFNIFSYNSLLYLLLLIYFFILPVLYRKFGQLKNLMAKFSIPLARWHHSFAFVLSCLIILLISSFKNWEIFKLMFSIIAFLIFLNPHNTRIYSKTV